jgi:uncharacterized membrane protein YgcG
LEERHVLIVTKKNDPWVVELDYASCLSQTRRMAELLTDNRELLRTIIYQQEESIQWLNQQCQALPEDQLHSKYFSNLSDSSSGAGSGSGSSGSGSSAASSKSDRESLEWKYPRAWLPLHLMPLGELHLGTLHMLLQLRDRCPASMKLYVTFLPEEALQHLLPQLAGFNSLDDIPNTCPLSSDFRQPEQVREFHALVVRDEESRPGRIKVTDKWLENHSIPAKLPGEASTHSFFYRQALTLPDALANCSPVSVLYLPSLMWYSRDSGKTQEELHRGMKVLLQVIQKCTRGTALPTCLPPPTFEKLTEQKDQVYQIFRADMLESRWVRYEEKDGEDKVKALDRICTELRAQWNADASLGGASSGRSSSSSSSSSGEASAGGRAQLPVAGDFMLKGSWSDGKQCVSRQSIPLGHADNAAADACGATWRKMRERLDILYSRYGQRVFGVQRFDEQLRLCEVRCWCHAAPAAVAAAAASPVGAAVVNSPSASPSYRWRVALAVETAYDSECVVPREQATSLTHPACFSFVEGLLQRHADFFEQARQIGLTMLRLDVFQSTARGRCFLNEITVPQDANYFAHLTHTGLIPSVQQLLTKLIFDAL